MTVGRRSLASWLEAADWRLETVGIFSGYSNGNAVSMSALLQ